MEKTNVLVRSIVRSFYEPDHVVIVDAIINHACVNLEDLKAVLIGTGRNSKDIAKTCARLREGGLLSVHTNQELRGNAQKATKVEYFFVNPQKAVDAIKYKIHMIEGKLRQQSKPTTEKKEWSCPRCKAQYQTLEVMDNIGPSGNFLCHRCGYMLQSIVHDRDAEPDGDNVLRDFNKQFAPFINVLAELEKDKVPEVTGEQAFSNRRPVPKEAAPLALASFQQINATRSKPAAVMGVKSGPEKVEITLTTDSEETAAAQAAETERKARIAQQNQLPEWHTRSTVSTDVPSNANSSAPVPNPGSGGQDRRQEDEEEKKAEADDLFENYLAALEEENRRKALQQAEEDASDEEEDEEDFEDVSVDIAPPEAKRVKVEDSPKDDGESDADDFEDVV